MGRYWFTDEEEFDPHAPSLNTLFREQVLAMREVFGLSAGDLGVELSSGGWVRYHTTMDEGTFEVQVLTCSWNNWETRRYANVYNHRPEGELRSSFTPVFKINLRVRKFVPDNSIVINMENPGFLKRNLIGLLQLIGALQEIEPVSDPSDCPKGMVPQIFFDKWIEIIFDSEFPRRTPSVILPKDKTYKVKDGEAHHIYPTIRQLCILADPLDWSCTDNITRAVFAAVDWIIWHQRRFGKC